MRMHRHSAGVQRPLATLKAVFIAALASCSVISPTLAGEFTISPIRIFMNSTDRAVAVTITNESDEPLVMQADLYTWTQTVDGQEVLELSEDIFMSPPIIKLEGREKQVVRLARLTNAAPPEQLTYRLIAREILPEQTGPAEGVQVQVALALSLPIFVTPLSSKSDVTCILQNGPSNPASVICENSGSAYAQLRELQFSNDSGEELFKLDAAKYILPGTRVSFNLPEDAVLPAEANTLNVTLDDDTQLVFDLSSLD